MSHHPLTNTSSLKIAAAYWSALPISEGDIGAPIFTSAKSLVLLAYFHTNSLVTGLNKTEKEIC
jgi:hypothetical protein